MAKWGVLEWGEYNVPLMNGIKCIENRNKVDLAEGRSKKWTKFK